MAVSGQDIVDYLLQYKGVPYVWGGNTPDGFDCSGLMVWGFKKFGIELPRVTYDQIGQGDKVGAKGLRVGDLVFFETDSGKAGPDHVGIYMGNGKMFHTPRPGKSAEITDMTSGYYMDRFVGGRRIAGVVSPGASPNDAPTEAEVQMSPEELAASYGWAYGFLNSNSELKKLFGSAVDETWTPEKFQAELRDTKWWKTTSDTARQAQVMKKTDPATWAASVAATTIKIKQLAGEIGAAVPASRMKKIVEQVMNMGIDADEDALRNILGGYVTFTKDGTLKGEAGMHEFTMKQFAAANGVTLSDQAVKNQAQLVVRKMATTKDFESLITEQAKTAFPGYADQLDAGMTMKDIASPYEDAMAKELELPSNPAGLNDQLIRTALNGVNKEGKPVGLSLTDFRQQLRNDPRWAGTSGAQDQVMATGAQVLRDMGLMG